MNPTTPVEFGSGLHGESVIDDVAGGILRNWRPPQAPLKKLLDWTIATTEMATVRNLAGETQASAVTGLIDEVRAGAKYAMDQSPQKDCRDCQTNCADCCHVMIATSAPEVLAIADYLRASKSSSQVNLIYKRIEQTAEKSKPLDRHSYADKKIPCPLLDGQECSVYPARPLRCQTWCSVSVERCHSCFASNLSGETVPLDAHAYTVGQGVSAGLSAGLQSLGLDGTFYEFNGALVAALREPDAAQRWIHHEHVFAGCKKYD